MNHCSESNLYQKLIRRFCLIVMDKSGRKTSLIEQWCGSFSIARKCRTIVIAIVLSVCRLKCPGEYRLLSVEIDDLLSNVLNKSRNSGNWISLETNTEHLEFDAVSSIQKRHDLLEDILTDVTKLKNIQLILDRIMKILFQIGYTRSSFLLHWNRTRCRTWVRWTS